jgi:hypothetical protein
MITFSEREKKIPMWSAFLGRAVDERKMTDYMNIKSNSINPS